MEDIKNKIDALREEAKARLKDDSLTMEDKWKILTETPELFETSWRTNFDLDRDDEFLYEDPCYMRKYETRDVAGILECLKDDEDFELTDDEEHIFKMYCIRGCYSRMKFDW